MALVSLSGAAVFFDDDVMLMASAMKMPMICVFFLEKEPGMALRGARQDERQDLSGPDEFQ